MILLRILQEVDLLIHINNLKIVDNLISSLLKIVPCCNFEIGVDKTKIRSQNDSKTLRCFMETNSITGNEKTYLGIQDLTKLLKLLNMVGDYEKTNCFDINFDGSALQYEKNVKFKLRVVPDTVISKYITPELLGEVVLPFSFIVSAENTKKLFTYFSTLENDESKVYISQKGNNILCELDNKFRNFDGEFESNTNSISIPISSDITGKLDNIVAVTSATFRKYFILGNTVKISIKEGIVETSAEERDCGCFVIMKMYSQKLKI